MEILDFFFSVDSHESSTADNSEAPSSNTASDYWTDQNSNSSDHQSTLGDYGIK
jgi:hypothetical protein